MECFESISNGGKKCFQQTLFNFCIIYECRKLAKNPFSASYRKRKVFWTRVNYFEFLRKQLTWASRASERRRIFAHANQSFVSFAWTFLSSLAGDPHRIRKQPKHQQYQTTNLQHIHRGLQNFATYSDLFHSYHGYRKTFESMIGHF